MFRDLLIGVVIAVIAWNVTVYTTTLMIEGSKETSTAEQTYTKLSKLLRELEVRNEIDLCTTADSYSECINSTATQRREAHDIRIKKYLDLLHRP